MMGLQIWIKLRNNKDSWWDQPIRRRETASFWQQDKTFYQHIDRLTSEGARF